MFRRKLWLFVLVLVLLVPAGVVYATKPADISGYFDEFVPGEGGEPTVYCIHTGVAWGEPDGFLDGCVVQPEKPGLAQKGTMTLTVDGVPGTCEYSLRTFDLDGIARFSMQRCSGGLEGFHMKGVGWTNGFWEGSYHFSK